MGILRKMTSVSTLGAIDFKSDKERTATSARKAKSAVRKQTRVIKRQGPPVVVVNQTVAPTTMTGLPQGWYADPLQPERKRWWSGSSWSDHTQ